jgi:predicted DCC family thiol-disulfide oxidoreductase YuxK
MSNYPLTLFYDAACPVCSLEMDHLRERDAAERLVFVDIGAPGFDAAAHGATLQAMNAEIHAKRPDGSMLKGVEVLRLAYEAVGLGWVLRASTWPVLQPAFEIAYRTFARHRIDISRAAAPLIRSLRTLRARRMAQRMRECSAGACATDRRADVDPGRSS